MKSIPGILLPPELVRESFSEEERLKMKDQDRVVQNYTSSLVEGSAYTILRGDGMLGVIKSSRG